MAATYVTVEELKQTLGFDSLYPDEVYEVVCQTAEDILNQYLWFNQYPVIGSTIQDGTVTLVLSSPISFTAGQSVTVNGVGAHMNGTHTVTATYPWSQGSGSFPLFTYFFPYSYNTFPKGYSMIQYAASDHPADQNYRLVVPYGTAAGIDTKETGYAETPAIRQAALMLAISIWQSRQAPNSGGVSIDGITPSPYRMGASMLGQIRGLIAPYMNPRAMVG